MLKNVLATEQLKALAVRRAKPDEFKSVRNPLVEEEIAKGWTSAKKNKTTTRLSRAKTHDKTLEDRVWTLMYKMGFTFLSDQGGAYLPLDEEAETPENQIDVVAIDNDVAFAIECKSSAKPRKFADFSGDLAKHVALRERFTRAVRAEYPATTKRPALFAFWTAGIVVTENDTARAEAEH